MSRTLKLWQVDAFTNRPFAGNPAAVVALDAWLDDATLQAIAAENNLSETAFILPDGPEWAIRWFTPVLEMKLCGHATLASAYVLFEHLDPTRERVTFASKSGPLHVSRERASGRIVLDFPQYECRRIEPPALLAEALGARPLEAWLGVKMMAVFATRAEVAALAPDFAKLARVEGLGTIATAPGDDCDFVSRYFLPQGGVPEDPVTGAAHCQLVPWWAAKLGRTTLHARQISARGGELWCEHAPPRVKLAGHAAEYLSGTIELPLVPA